MPVPADDIVCRFINPGHNTWNPNLNLPKQRAFKQANLSVWHRGLLTDCGVVLENLLIDNLAGYGQAHHTAGDYLELALQAARDANVSFQVQVEWRPDDEFVPAPWRRWRYAHVQVEAMTGPADFPLAFRRLLAANARAVVPPG